LVFVLTVCLLLTDLGAVGVAESADVVANWDMLVQNSLTHPGSVLCADFAALLEERSGGRIKITVRAPGELPYQTPEYLVAIGDGNAAIGDVNSANFGPLKVGALCNLPFLMKSQKEYMDVMDMLREETAKELAAFNVKYLYHFLWPPQSLWTKSKELKTFEDISNMKVRTSTAEFARFVQTVNAVPVTMAGAEVPTALQTNAIDGAVTAAMGLGGAGWYDSLKFGLMTFISFSPSYMCINQDAYDALPDDLKKILDDASAEFEITHNDGMMSSNEEWRGRLEKEFSFIIHDATEEDNAKAQKDMIEYWNEWVQRRGGDAPEYLQKVRQFLGI
jgi:TRAP-type C4-dicarboxylate transport system substrate-binding protein